MIYKNIILVKRLLLFITYISLIFQLTKINNYNEFISLITIALINFITITYCFNNNFFKSPFSYLIVFVSNMSLYGFALYLKSIELESIFVNLNYPHKTFNLLSFFCLSIVFTHFIFINFFIENKLVIFLNKIINHKNYFIFDKKIFFLITILYLFLLFFIGSYTENVIKADLPLWRDILNGYNFLYFAPLVIIYYLDDNKIRHIFLFFTLYLIFAMGFNSVSALFEPILILLLIYFYELLHDRIKLTKKNVFNLFIFFLISILLLNFLNSVAYNFYLERENRYEKNFKEKIISFKNSLKNLNKAQQNYNLIKSNSYTAILDEKYYKYAYLGRLNSIKIHDNFVYLNENLSKEEILLVKNFEYKKIASILPTPIIKIFNSEFKKNYDNQTVASYAYSFIDSKISLFLATGSFVISIWIYYSFFSFFLIFFLGIFLFSLTHGIQTKNSSKINLLLILYMFHLSGGFINLFVTPSLSKLLFILMRYIPQMIILYFFLIYVTNRFKIFK